LEQPPTRPRAATRTGRRLAAALYWILTFYVIGAGFLSVVPQIFWPAAAYGVPPESPASCPDAIAALRSDLLEEAASRVRAPGEAAVRPFLEPWDERYRALEASCGAQPSYALLARLRYRVEEHLLRFEADVAPLDEDTLRAIGDGAPR
jgi:hypothetical protein